MVLLYFFVPSICYIYGLTRALFTTRTAFYPKKRSLKNSDDSLLKRHYTNAKKPNWVKHEIITLKALMPHCGGRKIAEHFNRKHACKNMTVGKTFVYDTIKKHHYEIQVLQRKVKHKRPKPLAKNKVWGMDLTTVTDETNTQNTLFGVIDYGTRVCVNLSTIKDKSSLTLLTYLIKAIQTYGKPQKIITDNEAVFNSRLFNRCLKLLGITHQTTDIASPWQNGRIERFFGTLKEKTKQVIFEHSLQLEQALPEFRLWYNHVRPHSYLDGKTPAEVWKGYDIYNQGYKNEVWFEAWDGVLNGVYLDT